MRRVVLLASGSAALAVVWSGTGLDAAPGPFSAHMVVHVTVMSVVAPLIAAALGGTAADPTVRWPFLSVPMAAMLLELVVVWGWHVPAMHHAARTTEAVFVAEQLSFLLVGLALWLSVLGGRAAVRRANLGAGAVALLMTSMHMTLLGTLITLAPRPLYAHGDPGGGAMIDQQTAGIVMLLGGATSYLAGGIYAVRRLLKATAGGEDHAALG